MSQPFPGRDEEPNEKQRNPGTRNGFVGAFVRSVRRGPQVSAVGKVAIGALVVVLTAGSVVGLSVLLRGTGKPAAAEAVPTAPSASIGDNLPVSAGAVSKPSQDGKSVSGGHGAPGGPGVPGAAGAAGVPGVPGAPGPIVGNITETSGNSVSGAGPDTSTRTPSNRSTATNPATTPTKQVVVANTAVKVLRGPATITNYGSNRCIDVTDGHAGARLQIYDCSPANSNSHQAWTFYADETVRAKVTGQCMTAGSWASGATITAQSCAPGNPLQKFVLNGSHDLTNYSASAGQAKCVDVVDKATADGAKLQLWTCGGTPNQKWH